MNTQDNQNDGTCNLSHCSLREALQAANATTTADTITLSPNATYLLDVVDNTTDGPNGLPSITTPITIDGNGSTIARSSVDGVPNFRLFRIGIGGNLTLNNITLQNGVADGSGVAGFGGAILNRGGTVYFNQGEISRNSAVQGGGILNYSNSLTKVTDGALFNNSASRGGALYNGYARAAYGLHIIRSVLYDNSAESGGAVYNEGQYNSNAEVYVTDSTIYNNTALNFGGGFYSTGAGELRLTNTTVSGNSATNGGGLALVTNNVHLRLMYSTVAANTASARGDGIYHNSTILPRGFGAVIANNGGENCYYSTSTGFYATSYSVSSDATCKLNHSGNPVGNLEGVNARLGTLASNDSVRLTHALLAYSPAIDLIPVSACTSLTADARGVTRPQGGGCDAGAYETNIPDLELTMEVDNAIPTEGSEIVYTVHVSNLGPNTADDITVNTALPTGLTYVSASTLNGTYNPDTGNWSISSITGGAGATLTIVASVNEGTNGTQITTTASTTYADRDAVNNSASTTVWIGAADLRVRKSVTTPKPHEGDTVTYTVTVTNEDNADATNVVVSDRLDSGLTLVSATPSTGNFNAETGEWSVGLLQAGESATLEVTASVDPGTGYRRLYNVAEVMAVDQQDPDSSPGNNNLGEDDQARDYVTVCAPESVFTVADGDVTGLIRALEAANDEACFPGLNTVSLAPNSTYTLPYAYSYDSYFGINGLPVMNTPIVVEGNGAIIERDDLAQNFRILQVGSTVTLNNLTIRNGLATGGGTYSYNHRYGGGILNWNGDLTLNGVILDSNAAAKYGGAIFNMGSLLVENSLFHGNAVVGLDGPNYGSAIYNDSKTVTVRNTTFAANQGGASAFVNSGTFAVVSISYSTFSNETGGITSINSAKQTVFATIFEHNSGANCVGSGFTSAGYNLSDDATCASFFNLATDRNSTPAGLAPLLNNGGHTPSYALLPGSLALDAVPVDVCDLPADQNGVARPTDSDSDGTVACEIGSVEMPMSDLTIEKSVDVIEGSAGDPINFVITLANQGPVDAFGLIVLDQLPMELGFIEATATHGSYDPISGNWSVGELHEAEVATLTIRTVVQPYGGGEVNTNTASVSASSVIDPDGETNDSVSFSIQCPTVNFAIAAGDVQGLINAIYAANDEDCYPGPNTILLAQDATYTLTTFAAPTNTANALPIITTDVTIEGNDATLIASPVQQGFRFLEIASTGSLTLRDITLSGGTSTDGGALYNAGFAQFENITLNDNSAQQYGGALYSAGTLVMTNSQLVTNRASVGGGIYQAAGSSAMLDTILLSGNTVNGIGGAIAIHGSVTLTRSQIIGNESTYYGGGIYVGGTVQVEQVTFSENRAPDGSAIYLYYSNLSTVTSSTFHHNSNASDDTVLHVVESQLDVINSTFSANRSRVLATLNNSEVTVRYSTFWGNSDWALAGYASHLYANIFANNGTENCVLSAQYSEGYNISTDDSCLLNHPTDLIDTSIRLAPLADYGGETQTHALLTGNVAVDRIPPEACAVATDQRGISRPVGNGCDVGAFEGSITLPNSPQWVNARVVSEHAVEVTWEDTSDDETAFFIERWNSAQGFTLLGEVGANVTSYLDTTVTCGDFYYYRVRAYRADDNVYSFESISGPLLPEDWTCLATEEPPPEVTPVVTEEPTPEVTPVVTEEPTPEVTPVVTEEPTPEVTPVVTEEPTPEVTEMPTQPVSSEDAVPQRNVYTSGSPRLTWSMITWATGYRVQVDNNADFSSPEYRSPLLSRQTRSVIVTPPLTQGRYFWRVRARRQDNTWGPWSVIDSFSVDTSDE